MGLGTPKVTIDLTEYNFLITSVDKVESTLKILNDFKYESAQREKEFRNKINTLSELLLRAYKCLNQPEMKVDKNIKSDI